MRRTDQVGGWAALAAVLLAVPAAASAQAADDLLEVELRPWAARDGVERPFRYVLELRPRAEGLEVVADRRLLRFEARVGRRVHRCAHPAAPARVSAGRVRALTPDEPWREWVDLRMYCTGSARDAVVAGAEVTGRFGWPRATRDRWVARRPADPTRAWVGGVALPVLTVSAPPVPPTRFTDREGTPPVELALAATSARTGRGLALRVAVRAREGGVRVFVRPDAWHFSVRGPLGDVHCQVPTGGGPPPPELFRRLTRRGALRATLEASYFCPAGTFDLAGVYEITPMLRLPYDGEEWGFGAVRGELVGPPTAIRITHGQHGYLEQVPEEGGSS